MPTETFPEKVWTTDHDKARWGDGPWVGEPDKIQWVDPATGLDCLIVRGPMTALCGYVGVPPGHRYHDLQRFEAYDLDLDVHGGITFADKCMENRPAGEGVCHVPYPGRPHDVTWLGFDCGHAGDRVPKDAQLYAALGERDPRLKRLHEQLEASEFRDVYRDVDYVRDQVTRLAAQLSE